MNYPAASRGVSTVFEQLELLLVNRFILAFLTLLFNIVLDHRLIALFANGADIVTVGPKFTAP